MPCFPLGDTLKSDVRVEAEVRDLAVAAKPDSHDICFIADGDTAGFLAGRLGSTPGDVVDGDGTVLGRHDGTHAFTVGQRKGLRIGHPAPDGQPRFVLEIQPVSGTVTVGTRDQLAVSALTGVHARWCGAVPTAPVDCLVQIRAHGEANPARAWVEPDGTVGIEFDRPVQAVAPGQAAVLYLGSRVIGSATIDTTRRAVPA